MAARRKLLETVVVPLVSAALGAAALFGVGVIQSADDDVNCSSARTEVLARHNEAPPGVDEPSFPSGSAEQNECHINDYIAELNAAD